MFWSCLFVRESVHGLLTPTLLTLYLVNHGTDFHQTSLAAAALMHRTNMSASDLVGVKGSTVKVMFKVTVEENMLKRHLEVGCVQ